MAIVREDEPGDKRLVAYVVVNAPVDVETLKAALARELPEYMIPAAIVVLDSLPLTSSGKIDRKMLPAPVFASEARAFVAPRTGDEAEVARVFAEVLHLDAVGVHDNFFALGGHSLLAMRAVAQLRVAFRRDVPIRALFEEPTVERLAIRLGTTVAAAPPPVVPLPLDPAASSFEEQFVEAWEKRRAPSGTWNHGFALSLAGPLDTGRLDAAIRATLVRQQSLRHVFGPGAPRYCAAEEVALETVDARGTGDEVFADDLRKRVNAPFAFDGTPHVRFALFRRAPDNHVLMLNWHEIVNDPTGSWIVVSDLFTLYEGRAIVPLPVSYADYAAWSRSWFDGPTGRAVVEASRAKLAGAEPVRFGDRPGDAPTNPQNYSVRFSLDTAETATFDEACRKHAVTLYMAMAAVLAAELSARTEQDDFVFVTPSNFRGLRPELAGLAGRFISPLPLRLSLVGATTWQERLARSRRAVLAQATEQVPISRVYETESALDHPLGRVTLNVMGYFKSSDAQRYGDLQVTGQSVQTLTGARNNLFVGAARLDDRLVVTVLGASERFDATTIARFGTTLRAMMLAFAAGRERS